MNILAVALSALALQDPSTSAGGKPALELRLEVEGYYRDAEGKFWSSGAWSIVCAEGKDEAAVERSLREEGKEAKTFTGALDRVRVTELIAAVKKEQEAFKERKREPCGCDAPNFTVIVREKGWQASFSLLHDHQNEDQDRWRVLRLIKETVEREIKK